MHTQNVNVKTAGEETAGRWGEKPMRTDGFITNIHSRNPFDVIRADVVLARMEKQANRGCGLHYEIYEARLLSMAMNHLAKLPLNDRPAFIGAAAKRGYMVTVAEEARAQDECDLLLSELAADY
ncbi:TPA: hypothetical protein RKY22_005641 [Klebsiella michiganensis]|nr:hypothetical protein [Klebsiella michiganensis]